MQTKTIQSKIFSCLSVAAFLFSLSAKTFAQPVSHFHATYKSGQVFLQWENSSSEGATYNIYKSRFPVLKGSGLQQCRYLGFAFSNSAYNAQFSLATDSSKYFRIDSAAAYLNADSGLFVTTCDSAGSFYYAITTVLNGIEDTTILSGQNSLLNAVAESIAEPQPIYQGQTFGNFSTLVSVYAFFTSNVPTTLFPPMTNVGSLGVNFSLFKAGTNAPHQFVVKLPGGGGTFLSDIGGPQVANEWRICMDNNLPNDVNAIWFGYYEGFNIFSIKQQLPSSGLNYDYLFNQLNYAINWSIHHLPVDSNSVYFDCTSGGAAGALFASIYMPQHIAASRMVVPKVDLSYLYDPDSNNVYNAGKPGRLRIDTLLGMVSTNLPTNVGIPTYNLLNDDWLLHERRYENFPVMFMVSGKHDTLVGWGEKIPFYDSVNSNRAGGFYFWDMRSHNGEGGSWPLKVNLFRYHANKSYPAFSNCSVDNNPGDGHYYVGDPVGSINGFLDWNDSIEDKLSTYSVTLLTTDEETYTYTIPAPDSCTADVTLRRLQNFIPQSGDLIQWENDEGSNVIQQGSFVYDGLQITIPSVKIFKTGSVLKLTNESISGIAAIQKENSIQIFPNPSSGIFYLSVPQKGSGLIQLYNEAGQMVFQKSFNDISGIRFQPDKKLPAGFYLVRILQQKMVWIGKLEIEKE